MTTQDEPSKTDDGGSNESDQRFIFTTIRWQPELMTSAENSAASCNRPCPFYMLEHHWTRLQVAKWIIDPSRNDRLKDHTSDPSQLYHGLNNAVQQWQKSHTDEQPGALRIRLRCHVGGKITTETFFPLSKLPMNSLFPQAFGLPEEQLHPTWTIVLDTEATPASEATMFKTNDRGPYERAMEAARYNSILEPREVLLYSPDNEIVDGLIATPYFYRNGRWVAPAASSGGLQGTTRRWALEQGLCVEGLVSVGSLQEGEIIWLSNAVRGYYPAVYRIKLDSST